MAIVQDGILWPLRFASTTPGDLVVTVNAADETLTYPTVTLLRNYYAAYDQQADASTDGGQGDALELFLTMLNTHTQAGTFSLVDGSGDGSSTTKITHDTAEFTLKWTNGSTTLDTYSHFFGWDGTADVTSTSLSLSAVNAASGLWRPGCYRSEDSREQTPYVASTARTTDGQVRHSRLVTPKKQREVAWILLNQAKVLSEYEATTDPYGAFETAWDDAIGKGWRFRLYNDISTRTGPSDYTVYRSTNLDPPHHNRNATEPTLWDVSPVSLVNAED